jgi:hypothetical protein
MNIKDKILDMILQKLIRTDLFRLAYKKQRGLDILTYMQSKVASNFIKMFLVPDHPDYDEWRVEINSFLGAGYLTHLIEDWKDCLTYQDYYNVLFDEPLGHEGAVSHRLKSFYRSKLLSTPPNMDMEEFRLNLERMYIMLCEDLYKNEDECADYYIKVLREMCDEHI